MTVLASCLVGCQTVHTEQDDGVPVALWRSLVVAQPDGKAEGPEERDMVSRVLTDAGLHATVDQGGISIPKQEERRAREVLLTDKRLANGSLIVFLAIPAGTGRKTARGFEIPEVAPDQPMRMPGTTKGG